ncbi:hypothetical protein J4G37_53845, partial [Microvirga sp. 3-52]|nr:hypothetical protein [Microvirga sp. 3-52]
YIIVCYRWKNSKKNFLFEKGLIISASWVILLLVLKKQHVINKTSKKEFEIIVDKHSRFCYIREVAVTEEK